MYFTIQCDIKHIQKSIKQNAFQFRNVTLV